MNRAAEYLTGPDATRPTSNVEAGILAFLLLAAGIAGALIFHARTGFMYDDAFITFRYARHLAEGRGFVYNAGEQVLGTTSPLFTLLLAGLHRLTGAAIPWMAVICGGVALGGSAALLYLALRQRLRSAALWAGFALVAMPYFIRIAGSGMEETTFLFLVILTYILHVKRTPVLCGIAGFFTFLARPEGALWFLILLADDLVRGDGSWKKVAAFALPTVAWLAFSHAYFATFIPVNIFGKKLFFRIAESVGNTPRGQIEAALWGDGWAKLRSLTIVAGFVEIGVARAREMVFAIFGAFLLAALYVMNIFIFPWYWGGIYFVGLTCIAFALSRMIESARRRWGAGAWTAGVLILLILTGWIEARKYRSEFAEYKDQQGIYYNTMNIISYWINADSEMHHDRTIFAKEIGILGYETDLTIRDWGGLVSPELHPFLAKKQLLEALQSANADYVVYPLPAQESRLFLEHDKEAWFEAHYKRVLSEDISGRPETYDLFVRR